MQHKTLVGSAILIFAGLIALVATLVWQQGSAHPASAASGCGDLDGDGIVEMIDIILVSDHFSPAGGPPYIKQADQDKDGDVDVIGDILGVYTQFHTSTSCQTNTPLPKTTPAGGALAVDAQGESISLSDTVETKRAVAVGVPFEVSVHVTSNPGTISGYGLRLHWDEALLELTPRNEEDNDRWKENVHVSSQPVQLLGPSDDGAGSEAYIELGTTNLVPTNPTWSGTGPTAQFQFTCQGTGLANITLTDAGSHSVLLGRPAIEYTPTLANAQINCGTEPTPTPTATGTPPTPTPTVPTPTPKSTPKPDCPGCPPEVVLNVKGGDCDDPLRPTKCNVPFGSPFHLGIHALGIPANGYVLFQTFIDYGSDLVYKPAEAEQDEVFWPDLNLAGAVGRTDFGSGLLTHLALTNNLPPLQQSTYVGKLVGVSMNCPDASTVTTVDLLALDDPQAVGGGTGFVEFGTSDPIMPTVGSLTINCVVGPTPTPTPTVTGTPPTPTNTPVDTPTPTSTPTSAPTSTPTPGGPVAVKGLWFFELTGIATLPIEAVVDQTGTTTSSAGTKWSMTGSIDLSRNWSSSGTADFLSFGCTNLSTTATAAVDGNSVTGTWSCDAFSGSFTGFKDLDGDGIAFDIDDNPSVGGNSFSDVPLSGTTSGSIDNRNGLSVFVRDSAVEAGVRVTAIGLAGQASLTLCSDPAVKLLNVQASTSVDVSCGSATINVEGSPVTVQLGSVLATLPTGSKATANVTAPGVIAVTNSAASSGNIIVGGVSIAPAVTEAGIADTDGDGLADAVETDTGTYIGPGDTGTDPADSDTDGDGLSDGLEIMLYSSDVFDIDTDNDGCRDGTEVGTDVDKGGLRDPTNPWDYYDVNGDGVIDLFGDILAVIQHFSLDGLTPYDVIYDRGPSAGPNPWNMTAPDGVINLFTDVLGVIQQFTLTGCT